ncbi:MAG TPA: exosortase [Pyrinomonadaceae bacterium]|nr:exosortase [Pyrinomonadaceae bacterium]
MQNLTASRLYKPLILAGAVAFLYWGVLARLARFWWEDENYSHGLLIPLVIGYILWTERGRLSRIEPRPALLWGGVGIGAALLALWAGTAGAELFLQRTSLVLLLAGVALYFWGWRMLRAVAVPLLLLLLAVPIPAIIFNKIAFPLQLFASRCAVWAMRQFDITVLREGNVIELLPLGATVTKKLEVVEACSGIRSLMTLVTLAVVFAYFTHPSDDEADGGGGRAGRRYAFVRSALIVLAAVPIAIITNAARVSGTGVLAHFYGTEVADGFFHTFSGWVVYIAAFALLIAFGWLLDRFNPAGRGPRGGGPARKAAQGAEQAGEAGAPAVGGAPAPTAALGRTELN